jgi:hypothetical protein
MVDQTPTTAFSVGALEPPISRSNSATSWPAIIAGAFVAAAVSLILLALGSGLGFSSISPWPSRGVSGLTFAVAAAIWLILTQWLSSGVGGYIAGRLRTRWVGTHTHEVFFRDTAIGLITWAVATVLLAATIAATGVGAAEHAAAEVSPPGVEGVLSATSPDVAYAIDRLLRPAELNAPAGTDTRAASDTRDEVGHIVSSAIMSGSVPDGDRAYLAQLVVARTGVQQSEAQQRVVAFISSLMDAETRTKAAADAARKTAAEASIYLALSLVVGAFIASVSAALGGRLRDAHP